MLQIMKLFNIRYGRAILFSLSNDLKTLPPPSFSACDLSKLKV